MTNKPDSKDTHKDGKTAEKHPGMMGDGTEEQNLGQPGNPGARIKKDEVDAAFNKDAKKKRRIPNIDEFSYKGRAHCARPRHTKGADHSL